MLLKQALPCQCELDCFSGHFFDARAVQNMPPKVAGGIHWGSFHRYFPAGGRGGTDDFTTAGQAAFDTEQQEVEGFDKAALAVSPRLRKSDRQAANGEHLGSDALGLGAADLGITAGTKSHPKELKLGLRGMGGLPDKLQLGRGAGEFVHQLKPVADSADRAYEIMADA